MSNRWLVVLCVSLAVLVGARSYYRARGNRAPGADQKGMTIPALQAGDEEGLALEAITERKAGERRIRLIGKGGGEAVLTMRDTTSDAPSGFGFGKAVLEPVGDRARGAALVAEVARWLEQPVPPAGPPGELTPFPMAYVRLGARDGWEANKLFFERREENSELFLNLSADGRRARLLEKDEEYRAPLVAVLTDILRDGQAARRTPQDDPMVASSEPLFSDFRPLAGGENLRNVVARGPGFLAVREVDRKGQRGSELLRWTPPGEAPVAVAQLDGVISRLLVSPDGNRAGGCITYPKAKTGLSSADPAIFAMIDLRTGRMTKLQDGGRSALAFSGAFSPDSARFAFGADKVTEVHDLATTREIGRTEATLDLSPTRWDADGLLLRSFDQKASDLTATLYRWRPGQGKLQQVSAPRLRSPDGRYSIEPNEQGAVIRGPAGSRQHVSATREERQLLQRLQWAERLFWLGPGELVLLVDEPMALEMSTGKMRYLFPDRKVHFIDATEDGRMVVARYGDDRYVWAQRR
jgi:hypothetical protein